MQFPVAEWMRNGYILGMDAKTETTDEARLLELTARERELVKNVMDQHSGLTVPEAIEALREAGM